MVDRMVELRLENEVLVAPRLLAESCPWESRVCEREYMQIRYCIFFFFFFLGGTSWSVVRLIYCSACPACFRERIRIQVLVD